MLLARCGLGSRRKCEELVVSGRVTVDGVPITAPGTQVDPRQQKVEMDGESLKPDRAVYYMVNKPKGVLCTNADPGGRTRIIDLFPRSAGRLFPVGRLDENTVGLLIVTNDGELSHRLAHPKFRVPKIYNVQVAGRPNADTLKKLKEGMYFSDGRLKVDRVKKLRNQGQSSILEITLSEGRNREIRRLLARVGHKVMKLERVSFGPLRLRGVANGRFRPLSREEIRLLREYAEQWESRPARKKPARRSAAERGESGTKQSARTKRVVEINPIETRGGHDITGRRRRKEHETPDPAVADQSTNKRTKQRPKRKH